MYFEENTIQTMVANIGKVRNFSENQIQIFHGSHGDNAVKYGEIKKDVNNDNALFKKIIDSSSKEQNAMSRLKDAYR